LPPIFQAIACLIVGCGLREKQGGEIGAVGTFSGEVVAPAATELPRFSDRAGLSPAAREQRSHTMLVSRRRVRPWLECLEDRWLPAVISFTAVMDGSQEAPPNGSLAQGRVTLVFDTTTHQAAVSAFVTGIPLANVSSFHLHAGTPNNDGADLL